MVVCSVYSFCLLMFVMHGWYIVVTCLYDILITFLNAILVIILVLWS